MDYKAKIGENIRGIRKKLGLTIETLAEKTELSHNFVGNIERGYGNASVYTLIKLMKALGCSANDVFKGVIDTQDNLNSNNSVYIKNIIKEMSELDESQQKSLYQIFEIYINDLKKDKE